MDCFELQNLKTVNVRDVLSEMSFHLRGKVSDLRNAVASAAYVILVIQDQNCDANCDIRDQFMSCECNHEIKEIVERNLSGQWESLRRIINVYSSDVLKTIILFNSSYDSFNRLPGREPTPNSLIKLARRILDIGSKDKVLDMCSGSGNFLTGVYECEAESYTGVELNIRENDAAMLKAAVLGEKLKVVCGDALKYYSESKYTKAFSNYPFVYKGDEMEYCRHYVQDYFELSWYVVAKASSDWIFNAKLFSMLEEDGRAVAIMTNGAATNLNDKAIRKFFVCNGFVEAVISLPAKLFQDFSIPVTMMVFSRGNSSVTLVDAEDMFESDRRTNFMTEENINDVFNMIMNESAKSIKLPSSVLFENDYCLRASHYLNIPSIQNSVDFDFVIKNVFRGSQIKTEELEKIISDEETEYRYITLANVVDGIIEIEEGSQYLKELPKKMFKFVIHDNALILSKLATPSFRSAVARENDHYKLVAHGNLFIIELDEPKVNPYYLQAYFESEIGEQAINYVCSGSNVKTLSLEAIKKIPIPLPDLKEQNSIAEEYRNELEQFSVLKKQLILNINKRKNLVNMNQGGNKNG